ncbi:hypothetical protein SARC_02990 [Sphaeroforma arctica JP610]|uniref:Uncharacterized protein n=1 Tax=Sphaeroforma arctica JP610 TaxID=667725 RepID=A0A0L0G726_9EUKA|nr:hypothetical protein SARC_02990 [Sphaeroforma arctica JP610]KNC84815.1 hypothetical protein SARC_02990 [Sphaeroforma arctica JP610]|eukprot:XP_014158717.1 hypothetical protein SARC_02990 [Sphaeroforma arctica JP610]
MYWHLCKAFVPLETQIREFEREVEFVETRQYENPLQVYRNHDVLNLICQAAGGVYYRDTLHMHPHWRDYSSEQMRDVFQMNIDKAEEYRKGSMSRPEQIQGGSRSRSHLRAEANKRASPNSIEPSCSLSVVWHNLPPGPEHAYRCLKQQRPSVQTSTGTRTQASGTSMLRISTTGASTRALQGSGNSFRPRVNMVDGDQMPDRPTAETGENEVMYIHDLVDKSYIQSRDKLMDDDQAPVGWKDETRSN